MTVLVAIAIAACGTNHATRSDESTPQASPAPTLQADPVTSSEPACPHPPFTLTEIASVPVSSGGGQRLACFGDRVIRFEAAVAHEPFLTFGGPPGYQWPLSFFTGLDPDSIGLSAWRADDAIPPRDRSLILGNEGCPSAGCNEVLWEVSGRFNADVARLCPPEIIESCWNYFYVDTLRVLRERHRILRGETLIGVARDRGVTLAAILKANPQIADPNRIRTGDLVTIPR
jgi:hypothetical protein